MFTKDAPSTIDGLVSEAVPSPEYDAWNDTWQELDPKDGASAQEPAAPGLVQEQQTPAPEPAAPGLVQEQHTPAPVPAQDIPVQDTPAPVPAQVPDTPVEMKSAQEAAHVPVQGAKAKAGPPLPLEKAARVHNKSSSKGSLNSSSSSTPARPSKFAYDLPTPVPEYDPQTKSRLVCSPEEMKKFLFGSQASSSSDIWNVFNTFG